MSGNAPDVGWRVVTTSGLDAADDAVGHVNPTRLWYTSLDPWQANYASGTHGENASSGTATSPPLRIPGGAYNVGLAFSSRFEIEADDASTHDLMRVEMTNDGNSWQTLCTLNPATAKHGTIDETTCSDGLNLNGTYPCLVEPTSIVAPSRWETRSVSLGGVVGSQVIRFRFNFDTIDGQRNTGLGWMVTDARLTYTEDISIAAPPVPAVPPPPVPTLSEYVLMALGAAIALSGTIILRRKGGN